MTNEEGVRMEVLPDYCVSLRLRNQSAHLIFIHYPDLSIQILIPRWLHILTSLSYWLSTNCNQGEGMSSDGQPRDYSWECLSLGLTHPERKWEIREMQKANGHQWEAQSMREIIQAIDLSLLFKPNVQKWLMTVHSNLSMKPREMSASHYSLRSWNYYQKKAKKSVIKWLKETANQQISAITMKWLVRILKASQWNDVKKI